MGSTVMEHVETPLPLLEEKRPEEDEEAREKKDNIIELGETAPDIDTITVNAGAVVTATEREKGEGVVKPMAFAMEKETEREDNKDNSNVLM